jgi:hypothetical protein
MFVNYRFAKQGERTTGSALAEMDGLPQSAPVLYEYIVGANGCFVRAERPGLMATICVGFTIQELRGLRGIEPTFIIAQRVPAAILARMIINAWYAKREILYYLLPNPWRLITPNQEQTVNSVRPVDPYSVEMEAALIEAHSHNFMQPFFSGCDDRDERSGFRIYTVIGNLNTRPAIQTRVGIYGHFWEIPSAWVYEMPVGVEDFQRVNGYGDKEHRLTDQRMEMDERIRNE